MRAGKKLAVGIVSAVILISAGDIVYWYRLERRPAPAATEIPRLKWTVKADQPGVSTAPIVGRDGTLYAASAFAIQAFDPSSAMKWIYRLDQGDPVRDATLTQDPAGNLYFTTWKSVLSLSVSGVKRWQAGCGNAVLARDSEGSPFQNDALYASCDDRLVALDENDGREIWRLLDVQTQPPGEIPIPPLMLHNGEFVFSRGQRMEAYDRAGNTLWTYPTDPVQTAMLTGLGPNGTIYAGGFFGELVALDANGAVKWTFKRGRSIGFNENPVTASDGSLYAVAAQGALFALASNGTFRWAFPLPPTTAIMGNTPPVLSREGVIYQALDDRVIALSPERKVIWQIRLPGASNHRRFLALAPDGTLYAVTDDSFVSAIQTRN